MKKNINEQNMKICLTNIKNKKSKKYRIERSSSYEIYGDPHKKNYQYTSDSSEDNHQTRKRKFKPYE